jgi:hypothetical protein
MRGHFWVYYPSYSIIHYFNKVSRQSTANLFMLSCFNVVSNHMYILLRSVLSINNLSYFTYIPFFQHSWSTPSTSHINIKSCTFLHFFPYFHPISLSPILNLQSHSTLTFSLQVLFIFTLWERKGFCHLILVQ